jgi:hypothetical protein
MAAAAPAQPLTVDLEALGYITSLVEAFQAFDSDGDGLITAGPRARRPAGVAGRGQVGGGGERDAGPRRQARRGGAPGRDERRGAGARRVGCLLLGARLRAGVARG